MDDGPPPSLCDEVARTAIATAVSRVIESGRGDRLFDDPLAGRFVAAAGQGAALPSQESRHPAGLDGFWSWFAHFAPVRTRFFDDCAREACAAGCRQVVILAAGLDARAFRIGWPPGVRLFELDRPDVLEFKNWVVDREGAVPRCSRATVAADLARDWAPALRDAGLRPQQPTFWLAEGLMAYLTIDQRDEVRDAVDGLSAPGSVFAVEYVSRAAVDLVMRLAGDPPGFGLDLWEPGSPEDGVRWFARRGWQAVASDANERAARYGRPTPAFSDPAIARMLGEGPVATDSVIVGTRP
jgi:methyltransferase (TIGR00027 family)